MNQTEQMRKIINQSRTNFETQFGKSVFADWVYKDLLELLCSEQALASEPAPLESTLLTADELGDLFGDEEDKDCWLVVKNEDGTVKGVVFNQEWQFKFYKRCVSAAQAKPSTNEPAKLVRLTEVELLKAFTTAEKRRLVWQVEREKYLRHAKIVMDALEAKNGGK